MRAVAGCREKLFKTVLRVRFSFYFSVRYYRRSSWSSPDRFESRSQVATLQLTVIGCPAEGKRSASEEEDWLAGGTKKVGYFSEV
jgi:hypothetical protein